MRKGTLALSAAVLFFIADFGQSRTPYGIREVERQRQFRIVFDSVWSDAVRSGAVSANQQKPQITFSSSSSCEYLNAFVRKDGSINFCYSFLFYASPDLKRYVAAHEIAHVTKRHHLADRERTKNFYECEAIVESARIVGAGTVLAFADEFLRPGNTPFGQEESYRNAVSVLKRRAPKCGD